MCPSRLVLPKWAQFFFPFLLLGTYKYKTVSDLALDDDTLHLVLLLLTLLILAAHLGDVVGIYGMVGT